MATPGLTYTVRDRSLLLPLYKRVFITPTLPAIPRSVNPNSITHAGHLLNLLGTALLLAFYSPAGGWPFFVAAVTLQLYNWCDNADGGHARRTNQCSALGEFLDHGLDVLNTTYIAYMSAMSIGAPPLWWVIIAITLPLAAAVTYWEQAETGVFHLGILNQIESVFALSTILVVAGIYGVDVWDRVHVGPVTARLAVMVFVCGMATIGAFHGVWRVVRRKGRLAAAAPIFGFGVAVFAAAGTGALSIVSSVIVASAGYGFLSLRNLAMRTNERKPRVEWAVVVGIVMLASLTGWRIAGGTVGRSVDIAAAIAAGLSFGFLAVVNARDGRRKVAALDRAANATATA
jgi:phosphatidylglycerophosphate synthase